MCACMYMSVLLRLGNGLGGETSLFLCCVEVSAIFDQFWNFLQITYYLMYYDDK